MAELRSRELTVRDKLADLLARVQGGDRDAYAYANRILGDVEAVDTAVKGGVAGAVDAGGLTTKAAEVLGLDPVAAELTRSQEAAPGAATVGSVASPLSILGPVYEFGSGVAEATKDYLFGEPEKGPPQIMSKEEFAKTRRKERPTLQQAITEAEDKARNSTAYQGLAGQKLKTKSGSEYVPKDALDRAEKLLKAARASAEATWRADQTEMANEAGRIDADYEQYKSDVDRELEAYYGRSFADRNPGMAKVMAAGGPLLAAVLTGKVARGVNKAGTRAADDVLKARKSGDIAAEAEAMRRAQFWDSKGTKIKVGTGAVAATAPFDMQLYADLIDRKGLPKQYQDSSGQWQPVLAQKNADDKLSDWWEYAKENAPFALLSGAIGSSIGGKIAGKGTPDRLKSAVNPPDEAALKKIADRQIAEIKQAARVEKERNPGKKKPPDPTDPPPDPPKKPSEFASYSGSRRAAAQATFNDILDSVPAQARASYVPDRTELLDELLASTKAVDPRGSDPRTIGDRIDNVLKQFNSIRGSGGDPFSQAGRASLVGGKEKIVMPLAFGAGASQMDMSQDELFQALAAQGQEQERARLIQMMMTGGM